MCSKVNKLKKNVTISELNFDLNYGKRFQGKIVTIVLGFVGF